MTTAIATATAAAIPTRRLRGMTPPSRLPHDVPHPADRMQEARLVALLGLAAQVAHVYAQRVGRGAEVVAPHVLEDLRAGEHLLGVAEEQLQKQELGLGE